MKPSGLDSYLRTVGGILTAALILQASPGAQARSNEGGPDHQLLVSSNDDQNGSEDHNGIVISRDQDKSLSNGSYPVVPEAVAGWVLLPFCAAVLLLSARTLFRAKT
jgi:hypothetical protein